MKILLITNKTLRRGNTIKMDTGYLNTYVPLLQLGHQVYFYDSVNPIEKDLQKVIDQFKPELIFSCITGNNFITPYEQIDVIEQETKKGNIKTFNFFCDDTWRFDNFSSQMCWKFTCCSTPEPTYVQKYKNIGYNNIILGMWHVNKDLFILTNNKTNFLSFCGHLNQQRQKTFQILKNNNIDLNIKYGISYEDMLEILSSCYCGLNFSINENDPQKKTQMKLRIFEITAANSLLLTEYTPGLEQLFEIDKEIITFSSQRELFDKIKYLRNNLNVCKEISLKGHQRFLKDHESRIRLSSLIQQIEEI